MKKEEIEKLVDDEIARRMLREKLDAKKKEKLRFLRHPAFLAILAFFLTVVIGGSYEALRENRALAEQERQEALDAVHTLLENASNRRVHSSLLASGVRRGVDKETLVTRKLNYDEAYVLWNRELIVHMSTLRHHMGSKGESFYEKILNGRFFAWFAPLDNCLDTAYDTYFQDTTYGSKQHILAVSALSSCQVSDLQNHGTFGKIPISHILITLRGCEYAYVDTIARAVRLGHKEQDKDRMTNKGEILESRLKKFTKMISPFSADGGNVLVSLEKSVEETFSEFCHPYWFRETN